MRDPVRLGDTVREAIASGSPLVVVGGGDGTISSVVDYFAHRDVVLGILPLGTGNSFARTLGIPLSLPGALEVIVDGNVIDVDLGLVGTDYFANVATIGFSAEVAQRASPRLKRHLGVIAYVLAGARVLKSHRSFLCRLTVAHRVEVVRTHQVIVANGSYFGVRRLTAEASAEDRQAADSRSQRRRPPIDGLHHGGPGPLANAQGLGGRAAWHRRTAPAAASYLTTPELTLDTDPPQPIDVDGELITRTPAHFRVAPAALKVMAPRTARDG